MCVPFARPYCTLILPFLACYFENLDSLVQPDVSDLVLFHIALSFTILDLCCGAAVGVGVGTTPSILQTSYPSRPPQPP